MKYLILAILFYLALPAPAQVVCLEDCLAATAKMKSKNPMTKMMTTRRLLNSMTGNCQLPVIDLTTMAGETVDSELLRNKVVVLNFWFTTCPPCISELPGLNKLAEEYEDKDVVFLALGRDPESEIQSFLQNHAFNYLHVVEAEELGLIDQFCIFAGFPTNMVFDREGLLQHVSIGGNTSLALEKYYELQPIIESSLNK